MGLLNILTTQVFYNVFGELRANLWSLNIEINKMNILTLKETWVELNLRLCSGYKGTNISS